MTNRLVCYQNGLSLPLGQAVRDDRASSTDDDLPFAHRARSTKMQVLSVEQPHLVGAYCADAGLSPAVFASISQSELRGVSRIALWVSFLGKTERSPSGHLLLVLPLVRARDV